MKHVNTLCQESEDHLHKYEAQIVNWLKDHEKVAVTLEHLTAQNKRATDLLLSERQRIHGLCKEMKAQMKQCESITAHLRSAENPKEADAAIDESERYVKKAEDWKHKCQLQFPDAIAVRSSVKVNFHNSVVQDKPFR